MDLKNIRNVDQLTEFVDALSPHGVTWYGYRTFIGNSSNQTLSAIELARKVKDCCNSEFFLGADLRADDIRKFKTLESKVKPLNLKEGDFKICLFKLIIIFVVRLFTHTKYLSENYFHTVFHSLGNNITESEGLFLHSVIPSALDAQVKHAPPIQV